MLNIPIILKSLLYTLEIIHDPRYSIKWNATKEKFVLATNHKYLIAEMKAETKLNQTK